MPGSVRCVWPLGGVLAGGALAAAGTLLAAWSWTRDARWFELYTTRLCCITDPTAAKVFALERFAGIAAGVMLATASWPSGRAVARRSPRGSLGAVGRYGVALVLALAVCELSLRVVHPVKPPTVISSLPMADHDDKLGWRYRPLQTKITEFPGDGLTITYEIDALGNRAGSKTEAKDLEAPTVLFAGESITAGVGVPWSATFPSLVSDRLGLQGVNLGVHSYGVDQVYLRTLEALETFRRPVALVTLFVPDELERATSVDRAHLVLAADGSLRLERTPGLWGHSTLRDLLVRATRYQDGEELALAASIFHATAARARERGAVPLFVMTNFDAPCVADASGESALERTLFDDLEAPHVRVDIDPKWRLVDDPHPDARAARKLADAIAAELSRLGVRGAPSP